LARTLRHDARSRGQGGPDADSDPPANESGQRSPASGEDAPDIREPVPPRESGGLSPAWITYGLLALFLLSWEIAVTADVVDGRFISQPSAIVVALARLGRESEVRLALNQTLYALAVSFTVGSALGLVIGFALGMNRLLRDAFLPFVIQLLGIPKSVFLPLFILLFGLGQGPGIAFGILLSSIQVIINVVGGVDSIARVHYQVARAYGASRRQVFAGIILPGAAPGIFAGMWHGIRNAFIGVLVAQLFVSNIGVGYLVRRYTSTFRIDEALALVFFVAVVVILVGNAWGSLERRLSKWREVTA
jgi:ABC-type nitrate/sulfonate/bicarbonate transport system permease component